MDFLSNLMRSKRGQVPAEDRPAPAMLRFRSSKALIVATISYAIFVDQWVFAVIVPVMPFTLHDQVGIAESNIQLWIALLLAVYGIACALASPLWGWLVDKLPSRRTPFMVSLFVIFGATVMMWQGRNVAVQLVARVLQGIATCMVWVTGLTMLSDTVGEKNMGQASGYPTIGLMLGTLLAPLVGGVVLAKVNANAVYGITLGLIGVDILVRFIIIEPKVAASWLPDLQDELAGRSSSESLPTSSQRSDSTTSKAALTTSKEATLSKPSKARAGAAIVALLKSPRLHTTFFATIVQGAIFAGLEAVLPLQTQAVFGWDSIGGGLIFLPLTVPALLGPLIGKWADKHGPRWLVALSFLAMVPIAVCLRFVDTNTLSDKVLLCALLALAGVCYTATLDPIMAEMLYIVEAEARAKPEIFGAGVPYAQSFALFNIAWSVGNTVGPVLLGLLREQKGWDTMGWVLGLVCGVTAVPVFLWCGGWYFKRR